MSQRETDCILVNLFQLALELTENTWETGKAVRTQQFATRTSEVTFGNTDDVVWLDRG
jgi:hypothetical protein